jgi:hypothetical protein
LGDVRISKIIGKSQVQYFTVTVFQTRQKITHKTRIFSAEGGIFRAGALG